MKKLLATLIAATLILGLTASMALAYDTSTYFNMNVQCVNQNDLTHAPEFKTAKTSIEQAVWVKHEVTEVASGPYTNLFHIKRHNYASDPGSMIGQKWVTPKLVIPVQGPGFIDAGLYSPVARGNTNYHQYLGFSRINLTGTLYGDYY